MIRAVDLVDSVEAAELVGVSVGSFKSLRSAGRLVRFPVPLRLVSGRPVWRRDDVVAWVAWRDREARRG